jgi:hypothetical protein
MRIYSFNLDLKLEGGRFDRDEIYRSCISWICSLNGYIPNVVTTEIVVLADNTVCTIADLFRPSNHVKG